MKKLLFSLACLAITSIACAQVETGVNAGMEPWRRTFRKENVHYNIHGVGTISAAYIFSFMRVGLSYSRSVLTNSGTFGTPDDHLFYRADPMNEYSLFAAYQHHYYRTDNYAGVSVSYLSYRSRFDANSIFNGITAKGSGIGYGIFIGSTYRLFKGFCLNMQLAACRANTTVTSNGAKTDENFWYFPITAGIHYKLLQYDKTKKARWKIYYEDFNTGRPK